MPIPIPDSRNWNRPFGLAVRPERLRPGAAQAEPASRREHRRPCWGLDVRSEFIHEFMPILFLLLGLILSGRLATFHQVSRCLGLELTSNLPPSEAKPPRRTKASTFSKSWLSGQAIPGLQGPVQSGPCFTCPAFQTGPLAPPTARHIPARASFGGGCSRYRTPVV